MNHQQMASDVLRAWHQGRLDRRRFLKLAALTGLGLSSARYLTGCAPVQPGQAPAAGAVDLLNVALFSHDSEIQRAKGPAFTEATGIKLEFEDVVADSHRDKIISAHRAGSSPWDTVPLWASVVQEMADRGWLVDLTDLVAAGLGAQADDLVSGSSLFAAATYKDRIYAIPDKVGGPILQWNKALLSERGLDPEQPATWHSTKNSIDEFVGWAKELTYEKDGVQYWGYADNWGNQVGLTFHMLIQMYGGNSFDLSQNQPFGEPTMNSEEGVAALQWMVDLLNTHKCIDPASLTYNWVFDFTPGYLGGRTGFIITWPFVTHVAQDKEQSQIVDQNGFAPNFAAETSATVEGTEFQAISAYAPHGADAAWQWLEHATSKEMMRKQGLESGWAPIYKSLLNDPEITAKMFEGPVIAQSLDYPRQGYFTPDATQWDEILRNELHAALRLEKQPKEALDAAVEGIKAMRAG
ncbi:MAG: extracellular solute-binding protein [Caldilinea sp. CFX5]|nr:extracellular solute-binding protein [Caldilinea sp. CFX5]